MISIEKVHIEGYKKFKKIDVEFNDDYTVIVGDNESGKSTILEAIDLVLNKSIKTFDLSMLEVLLNSENKEKYYSLKNVTSLPRIVIQIFFKGMEGNPKFDYFCGSEYENSDVEHEKFGVEFIAEFDKDYLTQVSSYITSGFIPVEYYNLQTKTFGGRFYHSGLSDLVYVLVDSNSNDAPSFNSYSKKLFNQIIDPSDKMLLNNEFNKEISTALNNTLEKVKDKNYPTFDRDIQKSSLENVISIYESGIPLNMKGQGMESYIKTKQIIDSKKNSTIIAIEEPENHLSYSSMLKMISLIQNNHEGKQIIVTSHSSRITSGIGLDKVLIISMQGDETIKLSNLDKKTSNYFREVPSDSLLHFVMSKKVILVEGPAEQILMDGFYRKLFNESLESNGISCISVNGLSFKHFIAIAASMNKSVAVITDNDGNIDAVNNLKNEYFETYNDKNRLAIFSDPDVNNRTFEICLYNSNKVYLENIIPLNSTSVYSHKYSNGNRYLGKMLNQKTDTALLIRNDENFNEKIEVPNYINEALKFIKNAE